MSSEEALQKFIEAVRRAAPVLVEGELAEILAATHDLLSDLGHEIN